MDDGYPAAACGGDVGIRHWDGVAVEYSVNGGPWSDVPPPSNNTGLGCASTDDTTGWEDLSCTQAPPINGCGYPTGKPLYNGPLGGGTTCNDYATSGTVTDYAHRCHPISGLAAGDSVKFRWRFSSDPGAEYAGFYLDDVAVTTPGSPVAARAPRPQDLDYDDLAPTTALDKAPDLQVLGALVDKPASVPPPPPPGAIRASAPAQVPPTATFPAGGASGVVVAPDAYAATLAPGQMPVPAGLADSRFLMKEPRKCP